MFFEGQPGRPPPKRRGRIAHSCDACFTRKIKCNAASPRCDWCSHQNLPCTFDRNKQSPVNPPEREIHPTPSTAQPYQPYAPTFTQDLHFAGRHLGNICTFDGVPFFSASGREWIAACTGDEFRFRQPSPESTLVQVASAAELPLPDLGFLFDELRHYQSSSFALFFPVINASLFESTIKAAYSREYSAASPGMNSARACIFALLALTSLTVHGPKGYPLRYSDQYFEAAQRLLPAVFGEPVSVDGLQTVLLLVRLAGNLYLVDHFLSAAARFIYYLKGNVSPHSTTDRPLLIDQHIRELFWIIYVCDKGLTMVTGLPPRLEDSHCDLTLAPDTQPPHIRGNPSPGTYLHTYARLATLQSRIYRDLYSPSALRQSDADLLRTIRDLDHELEAWKTTLPPVNQPSFAAGRRTPPHRDMRFSIFHVQYHHCMVLIHQTSSRCAAWIRNQDTRGTSSSLAISVAASRALLEEFLESRLELGPENLLFSLSYFIQAVIVLFCHVLSQPLEGDNQEVLRLMGRIAELIQRSAYQQHPRCYTMRIETARGIILELRRLAECAIVKARGGCEYQAT
ncbi:putative C6 transcription factor [Aspergillus violaceofuscus CBS 115571]|uniref:Putative C6 transcription factor n=1 Tax=Aspergillus violaceofuscus (strain CBS 115571) TaxID=1450538 RepID=A0A2V5HSA5_ASPV1|nr:putative C6 transcription factor [Aspergillus violaceofuscus CBS 115571]